MKSPLVFRWLGVAGVELSLGGFTILIDPYFTRLSMLRVVFGRAVPNPDKIFPHIGHVDAILITHSHFDHCMDVPLIARKYKPHIVCDHNTAILLEKSGVSRNLITVTVPGDTIHIGPFEVAVSLSSHRSGFFMKGRRLHKLTDAPKRAFDYIMHHQFAFRINSDGGSILSDPGVSNSQEPVDLMFLNAMQKRKNIQKELLTVNAAAIVPIHWDNYFRPVQGAAGVPQWKFLPVDHYSPETLGSVISEVTPDSIFLIPEIFKPYRLNSLINPEKIADHDTTEGEI